MIKYVTIVAFLVLALFISVFTLSNAQSCNPNIKVPSQNPLRYKLRDSRCEGIYLEEFSGVLEVVYFGIKPYAKHRFQDLDFLNLEWSSPNPLTTANIQARGIRRDITNYRMDFPPQEVEFSGTTYTWPLDVLQELQKDLSTEDLSLVAWTQLEEHHGKIYLPINIDNYPNVDKKDSYSLELLPTSELIEVYVSLATSDERGRPIEYLSYQEPLEFNSYPAGARIPIALPFLLFPKSGIYYVEISARRDGGPTGLSLNFYHDDSQE